MDIEIIDDPVEARHYVDQVRSLADKNTEALGFLPQSAYTDAALKGHLWIAADKEKRQISGYLLFGGTFPNLRVFQVYVRPEFRGQSIAPALIEKLKDYGEKHNFMNIKAKVASELPANKFWQAMGFEIIDQIRGKTAGRINNIYCLELDVPSFFSKLPSIDVNSKIIVESPRPILEDPTFAIDVNVLFDVIQNRSTDDAARIIAFSMDSEIKLCVTHEFINELESKSLDLRADPVLALAKQFPQLPGLGNEIISPIVGEIRRIFLSGTPKTGKRLANDQSDFIHLASCIHHGVHGFITRDGMILSNAQEIYQKYSLRIYSPADVIESYEEQVQVDKAPIEFKVDGHDLVFSTMREDERAESEEFLNGLGVELDQALACLYSGTVQPRRTRLIARSDGQMAGICSWSNNYEPNRENLVHLYVDEDRSDSSGVIDHFLEASINAQEYSKLISMDLRILSKQMRSSETAIKRGFQQIEERESRYRRLRKILFRGLVSEDNWDDFSRQFSFLTNFRLSEECPSYDVASNTGVVATRKVSRRLFLTLFQFETLISPGYLIAPGRQAVMIPIRAGYADSLLAPTVRTPQLSFLPNREAALRLERAYFSKSRSRSISRETVVVFYISDPRMEAVSMARVTFADNLTETQALYNLRRQGVLSEEEIGDMADSHGRVFAFTFDNLLSFQNPISYRELEEMGCIGGANLVTAQPLSYQQFRKIIDKAFG